MFISPSKILYTSCLELGALNDISPDKDIIGISQTLRKGARYPKLQVVKKDGFYFTLNDTKLKLYRHLEAIGQCGMVRVEKVPIREVPEGIRKLMRVPENMSKSNRGRNYNIISLRFCFVSPPVCFVGPSFGIFKFVNMRVYKLESKQCRPRCDRSL